MLKVPADVPADGYVAFYTAAINGESDLSPAGVWSGQADRCCFTLCVLTFGLTFCAEQMTCCL